MLPASTALPGLDGKTHKFGDYRGKVVFVHFWSIRCPAEKYAEPVILKMEKKYAGKDVVLLVRSNVRRFLNELIQASLPKLDVLSYNEVVPARSVETVSVVRLED